jgi:hypothetical protein
MAISLEELKRQREQIQKHLDWLDAKIFELKPQVEGSETEPLRKSAEKSQALETSSTESQTPLPKVEPEPEIEPTYQAKTQNELLRAKVGCFLFFVLGIVLFIFLLFGLPYYL